MDAVIGLDFGNYYSYVTYVEDMDKKTHAGGNNLLLLPTKLMGEGMPSSFYYDEKDGVRVGARATATPHFAAQAKRLIKRHMGESFAMGGKTFTYQQAATMVIQEVIRVANKELYKKRHITTNKISLAYPVTMSSSQLDLLVDAAEMATLEDEVTHLEVVGTVLEPAAAALDYLCSQSQKGENVDEQTVLVYDLGGGTFDATILTLYPHGIGEGDQRRYYDEHLSDGLAKVGGQEFTNVVYNLIRESVLSLNHLSSVNRNIDGRMRNEAEVCKRALTDEDEYEPLLGALDCKTITRKAFEQASEKLLRATLECTKRVFDDYSQYQHHLNPNEAAWRPSKIVLTGGASAMPMVRNGLLEVFGVYGYTEDDIVEHDPSVAISLGAARYPIKGRVGGAILQHTNRDIGIRFVSRVDGDEVYFIDSFIPKRTQIPFVPEIFRITRTAYNNQRQSRFCVYEAKNESPDKYSIEKDWHYLGELVFDYGRVVPRSTEVEIRLVIDELGRLRAEAQEPNRPTTRREIRIDWQSNGSGK